MPLTYFTLPDLGLTLTLDKAPKVLSERGILPAALVHRAANRRQSVNAATPSAASPLTTCRRQILLERHLPYGTDPRELWRMDAGTAIHDFLAELDTPGYLKNVPLPSVEDAARFPDFVRIRPDDPEKAEMEFYPGVWMRMELDAVRLDSDGRWVEVIDYKSQNYPGDKRQPDGSYKMNDFGIPKGAPAQLNIYRHAADMLGRGLPGAAVWQVYLGLPKNKPPVLACNYLPLIGYQLWSRMRLDTEVKTFLTELTHWDHQMKAAPAESDREAVLAPVPLEGERLFGGQKCSQYCSSMATCFRLAGRKSAAC